MKLVILILLVLLSHAFAYNCEKTYKDNGHYTLNFKCNYQSFINFSDVICTANLYDHLRYPHYSDTLNTLSFNTCTIDNINETVVQNNTQIETINIINGNLSTFNIVFFFPTLFHLNLSNNQLKNINDKVFNNTPNLKKLDISFNLIEYLFESSFSGI